MRHLNYGHLLYFWTVARKGSVVRASEILHLTPQTISGQIRVLEESIGERLFRKAGRRLVLSEMGKLVFEYAEEIFSVGAELAEVVRTRTPRGPVTFTIGITDVVPKLVAARVLEPVLALDDPVRIVCLEGKLETLLADLAVHRLDMVLSDRPAPDGLNIRVYTHPLGESGVSFFAGGDTARRLRRRFPHSLANVPVLLPTANTVLRRSIDTWIEQLDLVVNVAGEFEDSALLKAVGQAGGYVFPGPTAIESEIKSQYRVAVVGRTTEVREAFYAISPERRLKHPAATAISDVARTDLFADS
jgi:LysR family transcriptional activator of nhaA